MNEEENGGESKGMSLGHIKINCKDANDSGKKGEGTIKTKRAKEQVRKYKFIHHTSYLGLVDHSHKKVNIFN